MLSRILRGLRQSQNSPHKRHEQRRVVITGIGVVTPIGSGVRTFWTRLLSESSGVGPITSFDAASFPCRIAAEVKDFDPYHYLTPKQISAYPRSAQFGVAAFKMAAHDAGMDDFDPFRTDVLMGAGSLSFEFVDQQIMQHPNAGREFVPGAFDGRGMAKYNINTPACAIAKEANVRGFVTTLSTACASGLTSIGLGYDRILAGEADTVICGGTDCAVNRFTLNLFCSAGFLCEENDDPEHALRPFDLRRTRSVLGEGACVFILEEWEAAKARGANPYAEVLSFHQEYENNDMLFKTDRSGERWAQAISGALKKSPGNVSYINAHATSDIDLDVVEAKAMALALGEGALASIPVTSLKGATGSPFSAAGALQVAAAAMSIRTSTLPPSCNFRIPDPQCPVNVVVPPPARRPVERVLVSGHAHGGVNAAVILGKPC